MSKREAINRYSLIIQRIRKSPATFQEISDHLERESELQDYNFSISKRTLKRDLEDIFSLYNIDIQYDFSKKVYRILEAVNSDLNCRLLEAFDTFNVLRVNQAVSHFIHFEKRRPQGTEHFHSILQAIQNTVLIKFIYHKFWNDEAAERLISPYALKEFKGRWYVLGKDEKDNNIKTFGLDRILDITITKKKFDYPIEFDLEDTFKSCFGIISPPRPNPETIILSFDAEQGKYIKSFPLHTSQQVIKDDKKEFRISLEVHITHDLVMEILSYGNRVKVVTPNTLITTLKDIYSKALKLYQIK